MADVAIILLAVLVYISAVFVAAWRLKRIDIVDIAWGGGFVVAALASLFLGGSSGDLQLLTTALVIV